MDAKRYVRTHDQSRDALGDLVYWAQQKKGLRFQGEPVTQEALVNASWVWMQRNGADWLAKELAPILKEMDSWGPDSGTGEPEVSVEPFLTTKDGSKGGYAKHIVSDAREHPLAKSDPKRTKSTK